METKFTPGPWRLSDMQNGDVYGDVKLHGRTRFPLAELSITDEERRANAALIAAAPTLYAAVEGLLEGGECDCGNIASDAYEDGLRCWFCKGTAALYAARGE